METSAPPPPRLGARPGPKRVTMSGGMKLWRLKRRLRKAPADGPTRVAVVAALIEAGAAAEARALAIEGLDVAPAASRLELGDLLARLDAADEAARAWFGAWHEAPDLPGAAARWGLHLQRSGRADAAVAPLRQALAQTPDDDEVRDALLAAFAETGATGERSALLEDSVARRPDDVDLLVRCGKALLGVGRRRKGIEVLRRAHRLRPDGRTVIALGVALGRSGASQDAVVLFEQYMAEHPDALSAQINCAVAYGEIGDYTTAVRYLLDAAQRAPHIAAVQQNLGVVYGRMGQLDAAVDALRLATRIEPTDARIQLQLARMLARRGDLHEGVAAASLAASLAGKSLQLELAAQELRSSLMQTVTGEFPAIGSSDMESGERPSAMSGDLMQFPLPNLLEFLRSERRTGLLQIVSMSGVGEIRLRGGDITSVSASQVPRLGELLQRAGHLDGPTLASALGTRVRDMPLGMHLVSSGAVTAEQLRTAAREQALQGLMELLPWEQGNFSFLTEDGPSVPESWSTQGMLLDALRRLDEAGYEEAADSIELVGDLFGEGESSPDIF